MLIIDDYTYSIIYLSVFSSLTTKLDLKDNQTIICLSCLICCLNNRDKLILFYYLIFGAISYYQYYHLFSLAILLNIGKCFKQSKKQEEIKFTLIDNYP